MAALAATGAFAQTTVEIYGRAHVAYDAQWKATGGTATPGGKAITGSAAVAADTPFDLQSRRRVADDGSRIGFRINEDLGGGLAAKAVIETGLNMDTAAGSSSGASVGQSGQFNSGTGFLGSRDAWVGLSNSTGDIRLGRQNNFWGNGAIEDVGANRIHFSINGAYTAPNSGWVAAPGTRFDNTVKFVGNAGLLGAFAGTEIWFAHPTAAEQAVPNSITSGTSQATGNPAGDVKAKAQGITIKFNQGPWAVQYDYAKNANRANGAVQTSVTTNGAFGTINTTAAAPVANNDLIGQKLGVAFSYAEGSKVYWINSQFKQNYDGAFSTTVYGVAPAAGNTVNSNLPISFVGGDRKQSNNLIGVQHRLGNWELHLAYAKQGNAKIAGDTLDDSGSTAYTIGARYDLSKRTAITVAATQIKNDKNNNINVGAGGQSSYAASATDASLGYGSKLQQMGVSLLHNF